MARALGHNRRAALITCMAPLRSAWLQRLRAPHQHHRWWLARMIVACIVTPIISVGRFAARRRPVRSCGVRLSFTQTSIALGAATLHRQTDVLAIHCVRSHLSGYVAGPSIGYKENRPFAEVERIAAACSGDEMCLRWSEVAEQRTMLQIWWLSAEQCSHPVIYPHAQPSRCL